MKPTGMATRWAPLTLIILAVAIAGAAIDRGGVARGVVANVNYRTLGVLRVAGVDYDISQAKVLIDGIPSAADQLREGQLVELRDIDFQHPSTGPSTLPTVGIVTFRDAVQGPISRIVFDGRGKGQLTVLGQHVTLDERTRVSGDLGGDLNHLRVGTRVEVSGYAGLPGSLYATRVDPAPAGAYELTGEVARATQHTITIGNQVVDLRSARAIGFGPLGPRRGDWVEVAGTLRGNVLLADWVERRQRALRGEPHQEIDIEGVVTDVQERLLRFEVDGTPVRITEKTEFTVGAIDELRAGFLVAVQGEYDQYGYLVLARSVRIGADSSASKRR